MPLRSLRPASRGAAVVAVLVAFAAPSAIAQSTPEVRIGPAEGLLDAPIRIDATGLEPHSRLTIALRTRDRQRRLWRVESTRTTDADGSLRFDAAALLPDMAPANPSVSPLTASLFPPYGGYLVDVEVRAGGRTVARVSVRRVADDPSIAARRLTWGRDRLVGRYTTTSAEGERPAVLILGGSEGGMPRSGPVIASLLGAHGYATLQLAYFGVEGLPAELKRIPLEYLGRGLRWLARQRSVDPDRIVVLGSSRGAELALLLGTRYPRLVHGVAAYSPSSAVLSTPFDCTSPAWTYRGKPIRFLSCGELQRFFFGKPRAAAIAGERIRGPILLVAGGEDLIWPAADSARRIGARLRRHDRHNFASLIYADAGHGVASPVPYFPVATVWGLDRAFGGLPSADARARTRAWFVLLRMLERAKR